MKATPMCKRFRVMSNRPVKFLPRDWAEVKSLDEIAQTLDADGILGNLSRTAATEEVELA